MSNDVEIYRGSSLDARMRYASAIADARGLLPKGIVTPPQALLIFEQASALGIPPITGLSQIHIINGKPTLSAGLMSGLIRQAGHKLRVWVEGTGDAMKGIAELVRSDDPDFTFHTEFSIRDATQAGLLPAKADANWSKYPRAMLIARVTAEIARMGATDVFVGSVYTPDEIDPTVQVDDHGELVAQPAPQMSNLSPETTESSEIKAESDGMPEAIRAQWFKAADALRGDHEGLTAFFKDAKAKGLLSITAPDDPDTELGQYVIALGKEAAHAAGAQPKADPQTGEVVDAEVVEDEQESEGPAAVLDPNIVDAEEVAESPTEAPAKPATRSRARKPANAPDAGAQQG